MLGGALSPSVRPGPSGPGLPAPAAGREIRPLTSRKRAKPLAGDMYQPRLPLIPALDDRSRMGSAQRRAPPPSCRNGVWGLERG
jgi:hypothetical protein